MPTPSPVRHGTASCSLPVLPRKICQCLPLLTLSTWVAHRCPSASHWVGMITQWQPRGFAFCVRVCACHCVVTWCQLSTQLYLSIYPRGFACTVAVYIWYMFRVAAICVWACVHVWLEPTLLIIHQRSVETIYSTRVCDEQTEQVYSTYQILSAQEFLSIVITTKAISVLFH